MVSLRVLPLTLCFGRCLLLIVLTSVALLVSLHAQDGSSALNGVVEDVTGARVAAARVTVANPENGFRRQAATDATGNFSFAMLPPGRYTVSATAPGMEIV